MWMNVAGNMGGRVALTLRTNEAYGGTHETQATRSCNQITADNLVKDSRHHAERTKLQ